VNNRKVCEGYLRGLGLADPAPALQTIDKLDKIGPSGVIEQLLRSGVTDGQAKAILAFAEVNAPDPSFADAVRALGVEHPLLDEGLGELIPVIAAAHEHAPGLVVADMRIVRGLDYYTGTVYEARLRGYERFGSVCAGGRYDNLATSGADRFPGVGLSIGVSRLLGLLFGAGALTVSRQVPTCVLVALPAEENRPACNRVAAALRRRGVATEVAPSAAKYGKQIRFAERRGIPYVWFPGAADAGDEVRDIRSGEQIPADAATWTPPPADLRPLVTGISPEAQSTP
jgi:histidyl-tRNA synthetase